MPVCQIAFHLRESLYYAEAVAEPHRQLVPARVASQPAIARTP